VSLPGKATQVRAAAIYARISSDQDGTTLGVQRQLEDCRELAADLGWPVGDEYVDNDLSAYSGKRRPEYERLLADLADGTRDAVLIYHVDRLTRRPIELEPFLDVLTAAKVRRVRFVAGGDLDGGNGDGLMVLRMLLAVAANESATKSRRVKRKMLQNAEAGLPHGGHLRPFGYDEDKVTIRPDEAQTIRALAERFLAGESLRSLAVWLDEQEIQTVAGGSWRTPTLRALLASGRIAGLRDHQGQVIGKAVWEPIITEQTRARILSRMAEQKTSGRRSPRRYLLSGLLRCHRCEHTLYSAAREDVRRYVCSSGPDHGGCGGTFVVAGPVEDLIAQAVLYRLDTPELADALAGRAAADERTAALAQALAEDQEQLAELTALYAAKSITAREWMEARNPIQGRIAKAEQAIARATRSDALAGLVGNGEQLRDAWAGLNLTRQAAIVRAVLDHAVIGPGTPGAQAFDPARVRPVWRL
jgi:site-specific DNA recombinase